MNTDALKTGPMSEEYFRRFAQQVLSKNADLHATNSDLVAKGTWLQRIAFGKKSECRVNNKTAAKAVKASSGGDAPITGTLLSTPVQNNLMDAEADAPPTDVTETFS